jgi:hypothetical protein
MKIGRRIKAIKDSNFATCFASFGLRFFLLGMC